MMITCKEDLINTYIENDYGELRDLYLSKCVKFKIDWVSGKEPFESEYGVTFDVIGVNDQGNLCAIHNERHLMNKELTLSDLKPHTKQYAVLYKGGSYSFQSDKPIGDDIVACFDLSHSEAPLSGDFFEEKPRTKVEYEKVQFEPEEIWKAFKEHQEDGFLYVKTSDEYECLLDGVFNLAMAISQGDQLYRRIETPITEREAFIELMGDFLECKEYEIELGKAFDSGKFKLVS